MRRDRHRAVLLLAACALVTAACGGGSSSEVSTSQVLDTTTSSTMPPGPANPVVGPGDDTTTSTTSTSTTVAPVGDSLMAREGDRNETVEALQFLLDCTGADLAVDGAFGPGTRAAVEAAQERLGVTVDGVAGAQTFTALSRACTDPRPLDEDDATVVGNAAPGDPEKYAVTLVGGGTLRVIADWRTDLDLTLADSDGTEVDAKSPGVWMVDAGGEYLLEVTASSASTNFSLAVEMETPEPNTGSWILATDGITHGDTTLAIGDDAQTVIDHVFDLLGHGVRGSYDEFDTGWDTITEPGSMGLRGVFIEGLAFLFFGPHPEEPDRPETLERIRFEGAGHDADGQPRPDDYVTTAEGITVGDPLAELKAAYGDRVRAGSNTHEQYYRLADSGGELCFYFGSSEPDDQSEIIEIATECRD